MAKLIDMTGKQYGNLIAIKRVGSCGSDASWLFLCECGNKFKAKGYLARVGRLHTCPKCSTRRGADKIITHGDTSTMTAEYRSWSAMRNRCLNKHNKNYDNYGGRGINISAHWDDYENFLKDMGRKPSPGHSLDRIDNDGDYSPENCRWASPYEQANNRRSTIKISINGVEKSISEWCQEYGCTYASALYRKKKGLKGEKIFKTPRLTITFNGITDTIPGWSKRTGIHRRTLYTRIREYKWPIEKALTVGAKNEY